MQVATVQFKSEALFRHVTYSVVLPEVGDGPWPVLLLLHGLTDDHTAWLRFSNLVRHAQPYPLLIVLPDGGTSFYMNRSATERYEDFLMQDLWQHVCRTFRVRPGPWAIGGLSMGGYGAMRLGCKYPDRFASVWAHSGWYGYQDAPNPFRPEQPDVYELVERLARSPQQPVISFDCGTEDFLIEDNRRLHAFMLELGLPHTYREHPGGHTWDYWDLHVREALAQHAAVLCR